MPTKKSNNNRGLKDLATEFQAIAAMCTAAAAQETTELNETGTPVSVVGDTVYGIERRALQATIDVRQIRAQMSTDAPDDGTGTYGVTGGGGGGGGGDTGPGTTGTEPTGTTFAGFIGSDVPISFSVSDGTWSANTHTDDTYFPSFASVCNVNGGTEPCDITLTLTVPATGNYDVFLSYAQYPTASAVQIAYPDAQTEDVNMAGDNMYEVGQQIGTNVALTAGSREIVITITAANPSPSMTLSKIWLKPHGA